MRLTRRKVIKIAGAATAVATVRPSAAFAARGASFALDVSDQLPRGATAAGAHHTLPVMRAPRRFDLLGLDFGPAARVHAEVRARRRGGPWTGWAELHGPTQPCWTGSADLFQVRFTGTARRLRARFVRVGAAPRPVTASAARSRSSASQPPTMISRKQWGGDRYPPKVRPIYGVVRTGFVHHTVTANTYRPQDSASIVLGICRYHRDHNGWNDIGYNFLVDKYGQIFEGRDGGIDLAVVGAQAQGYNSNSTGVSCLGDYTSGGLSAEGVAAVARLLAWKLPHHGAPVRGKVTVVSQGGESNRYRSGTRVTLNRICGHRDGDATSCPGSGLYVQLDDIRDAAEGKVVPVDALTIRADVTELTYPDTTLALAGALRFDDDSDPAGAPLRIQYRPLYGGGWDDVTTVATDDDGVFAADLSIPGKGQVRAIYDGDAERKKLRASPISVSVVPRLSLSLDPRRLRVGRSTTVTGALDGPGPRKVTMIVQRKVGSRYYLVSKRRLRVRGGVIDASFEPPSAGLYGVTLRGGGAKIRRLVRAV